MRLGDARSITGSDRMRSKKLWSEGARQDLAVHVFWDRRIEDEVGAFAGKWAMEILLASVNARDDRLAGTRIFQLPQFLNDKVSQRVILRWFHNASGFYPF